MTTQLDILNSADDATAIRERGEHALEELLIAARRHDGPVIVPTPFGPCLVQAIPWHDERSALHYRRIGWPITPGVVSPHRSTALRALSYDPRGYPSAAEIEVVRAAMAQGVRHVWTRAGDVVEVERPEGRWPMS